MKHSFHGGVHPLRREHEGKPLTSALPVRPLPVKRVVIPMGMHLGAPSAPCVSVGDRVLLGQRIADPVGGLGLPVHASVSGRVAFIGARQQLKATPELCVAIDSDGLDEWIALEPLGDAKSAPADKIAAAVKAAGICGMGGAAFPTHVKLSIPDGKSADTIIINGAECEPYLTADHRLMLETPERVADGLRLILRATGAAGGVVAIESNKPDAIQAMMRAITGCESLSVLRLTTKYPQGSEKQLIEVVTGRQVPRGKLPIDARVLVLNAATAAAIADAVICGKPLVERITTVSGCVREPANLLVRVGTRYADMIEACGGLGEGAVKLLAGGPMTAPCAASLEVSVGKAGNGIVALDKQSAPDYEEEPCIRCGRCVEACPIGLMPYLLRYDGERADFEAAKRHGLMDCVLCGACAYACPARRYLAASIKAMRDELTARGGK